MQFLKNKFGENVEADAKNGAQEEEAGWGVCHCTEEDCYARKRKSCCIDFPKLAPKLYVFWHTIPWLDDSILNYVIIWWKQCLKVWNHTPQTLWLHSECCHKASGQHCCVCTGGLVFMDPHNLHILLVCFFNCFLSYHKMERNFFKS